MKKLLHLIILACIISCAKQPLADNENNSTVSRKDFYVRLVFDGKTPVPKSVFRSGENTVRLFIFDSEGGIFLETTANNENALNNQNLSLPYGTYKMLIILNVAENNEITYTENSFYEDIVLKINSKAGNSAQAPDVLAGQVDLSVNDNFSGTVTVNLLRKVGQARLCMESVPSGITDIKWSVIDVPGSIDLDGNIQGDRISLGKSVNTTGINPITSEILLFPDNSSLKLSVSWKDDSGTEYNSYITSTEKIYANKITEINVNFPEAGPEEELQFSFQTQQWVTDIIDGGDFTLTPSQNPFDPQINNLLLNGDFELWESTDNGTGDPVLKVIPSSWKFYSSGSTGTDKITCRVNGSTGSDGYAVRVEGKTCLYQDIAVTAGKQYRISLPVYSPDESTRWRYFSSWRQSSSVAGLSEESKDMQTTSYLGTNTKYTDMYSGKVFTAPTGATLLRVEIRSYDTRVAGEGLYIDNVTVQEVIP